MKEAELQFGEDYYWDGEGFMVFTAAYLKKRGYCCHQGCRHCPYGETAKKKDSEANPQEDEGIGRE